MSTTIKYAADVALRYMGSFETGDADAIASNVTEDFVNIQTGALGKGCETRETYRERLTGFLSGFKNLRYAATKVIEQGETVAIAYDMTANSGGHAIDIPGVMIIVVRDGLVASRQDFWDGVTFLEQTKQR